VEGDKIGRAGLGVAQMSPRDIVWIVIGALVIVAAGAEPSWSRPTRSVCSENRTTGSLQAEPFRLWDDRFQMTKAGGRRLENNQTGFKLATSVGGVSTGERGDRILLDDPHNVIKAESDAEREKTVRFVRESMSNRLNDSPRSW
jgi:hypothetical protein